MKRKWSVIIMAALTLLILGTSVWAQAEDMAAADAMAERIAALEAQVTAAQSAGDNAWMLTSASFVLLMTGPGLILFYGGLVRRKNVLSTMMHSFFLMGLMSVLFALFGFSLTFAPGNSFLGGLEYVFLNGVGAAPSAYAPTVPFQTFMIFQLMFAIITPALISGAFAERIKFSAMVLFSILWYFIIYTPLAHMVWGAGGLLNAFSGGSIPTLDFAGGTVVHISSGVSALVCALYLGRRVGYPREPMPPHSVVLSVIGACLLWVGWFGFNAGSALSAGSLASSAFVVTHLSTAAACLGWAGMEWIRNGKPSVLGAISGAVAGLVGITPGAGFVGPMAAIVIGLVTGVVCYFMVSKIKWLLGYDDALDAFGVHGMGGTVGALLTGVFATAAVNPGLLDEANGLNLTGLLSGNFPQLVNQGLGALIGWVMAGAGTWIILKVVDLVIGVRVKPEEEITGLDLTQHGEEGYNL